MLVVKIPAIEGVGRIVVLFAKVSFLGAQFYVKNFSAVTSFLFFNYSKNLPIELTVWQDSFDEVHYLNFVEPNFGNKIHTRIGDEILLEAQGMGKIHIKAKLLNENSSINVDEITLSVPRLRIPTHSRVDLPNVLPTQFTEPTLMRLLKKPVALVNVECRDWRKIGENLKIGNVKLDIFEPKIEYVV